MCPQLSWIEQRPSKPWVGGSNPFGHIYLFHSVALLLFHMDVSLIWWVWRSWLARQIVALEAEGSSPSIHPFLYRILSDAFGLSPSGKAQDFDSCIRWFESSQPSQKLNLYGPLAQAVEHLTFNQVVRGSSPRWLIKISDIILYLIFLYLLFCSLYIYRRNSADMAELADALDLGSSVNRRAGSTPVIRIKKGNHNRLPFSFI